MKKLLRILLVPFLAFSLSARTVDKLKSGFITPPDSIQTSVYWYWISDNTSKDGVIRDLESMKKVGINRAFIGNIGLDDVPYGKVKMLTPEWWDILHVALKKATELNIEIGIFNSPGWSQSGGPWVSANEAMRYLTSSELRVSGPRKLSQKLEKPIELFQDVKVLAYPASKFDQQALSAKNAIVSSTPKINNIENVIDQNQTTEIVFPINDKTTITIDSKDAFTARSLTLKPSQNPIHSAVVLQAKNKNGDYVTVTEFMFNRANPEINVGFVPYAPVVVSFATTTSNSFRLVFDAKEPEGWAFPGINTKAGLTEIIISTGTRLESYSEKTMAKMHPTPLPLWKEYQWRQQPEVDDKTLVVDPSKVMDISTKMTADGTLNWDVPAGDWVIVRTGMTPTGTKNAPASPEATGYEVDKMSKKHAEMHFYGHIGEVLKRIPEADRKTFKVVVQDSYEMGGTNFTDDFLTEFKQKYGYDALPYLPVYNGTVVNSQQASDRFLWDMRRMVADKVAYDYVGGMRDVSHKHGLKTWLEGYGHWGFPSEFLMYGGQSDEISGEFWSEGTLGDIENRAATSTGHIYGKNKISAESNTCGGLAFSRYPAVIKQRGDRFFAEGINNTLLHVYITQPYEDKSPGINAGFGNEFNRKNTWFSQLDVYIDYLKRTNYMLQQGLNVADAAYFIGEDTPKMTGVCDPALPIGYQFDYMNAEVIEKYMTVKDGLITLPHGTQYRILILPTLETMRPELLKKIGELVNDGAVVMGPAPTFSPSLQNQPMADAQVKALSKEIWGNVDGKAVKSRTYGKGLILCGMTMEEALEKINCVPDCRLPETNIIHYGHRKLKEGDIYFLTNQTDKMQEFTPEFRVKGLQAELWEATTGNNRILPVCGITKNGTTVPMKLAPYESVFVVFRDQLKKTATKITTNYPSPFQTTEITKPWSVKFNEADSGPKELITFNTLQDWSLSKDERIKYYSGTAFYTNQFKLNKKPANNRILLNLGTVTAMAKVKINGVYVGGVWTAPYQLDISNFVRKGENSIEVEVVNTWINRIIGDLKLPVDQRKTWLTINPYNAESPLQSAGLLGPVSVIYVKN